MKRLFDIVLACLLGLILILPVLVLMALIWIRRDGDILYIAERMGQNLRPFRLYKLRTMAPSDDNSGVSGGDKTDRITALGRWLRRTRADEIPQLWNILKGDMSFVGPRPPLRQYTDQFPDLYRAVLRNRPGVTGLASLIYHGHEGRILARCETSQDTDALYVRACVPRKATLDLLWAKRRGFCFDLWIIWQTGLSVLPRHKR